MWKQFTSQDSAVLLEFVAGLKRTNSAYASIGTRTLKNMLDRKPEAEGWYYNDGKVSAAMIVAYKESRNCYFIVIGYWRGDFKPEDVYKNLLIKKMDEYLSRHKKSQEYEISFWKSNQNDMANFDINHFKSVSSADKTVVTENSKTLSETIRISPK